MALWSLWFDKSLICVNQKEKYRSSGELFCSEAKFWQGGNSAASVTCHNSGVTDRVRQESSKQAILSSETNELQNEIGLFIYSLGKFKQTSITPRTFE